jgi:hypothetical protein
MRALVFPCLAMLTTATVGFAQDQPGALRGVYGPPGSTAPAAKSGKSTFSSPDNGAIGNGPRITISQDPSRGQMLPSDVRPAPISDRPGYGTAIVNGRRAIVDLNSNRIVQVLD